MAQKPEPFDLDALSDLELEGLYARIGEKLGKRKEAKAKDQPLLDALPDFIRRVVETVSHGRKAKGRGFKRYEDIFVTSTGFYRAERFLALPEYRAAVAKLEQELGVIIEIYQGSTSHVACGEQSNEPDARAKIDLAPDDATIAALAVTRRIIGAVKPAA